MPQNYIQLTYPYPYKNISGTASTTLSNTYGGIGAIPAADGNGVLYPVNTVAPAYNSALTFGNTNIAPVFTPILSGGSNIVTAPSLGSVGYVLSVAAGNTTAWVTVSSLPAGNASSLESATWESPGTIGSITPNTGAFTTLTSTAAGSQSFLIGTSSGTSPGGMSLLAPNLGIGASLIIKLGTAQTLGNNAQMKFINQGSNDPTSAFVMQIATNVLTMYNSTSTATTITSPLTSSGVLTGTQLTSNVAIGTAPLVITSTTLVPNLYVARSVLSDTVTTNANLTGDITSSGNATTYNNSLPIAIGGTGGTGGFASPTAIGSSTPNTGAFTTLISTSSTASSTTPGSYIVNTNANPQCSFAVVAPNMPNAGSMYISLGKALSNNNGAAISYTQQLSVGSNSLSFGFYGNIGANFTMYNSIIASTLNTALTCTGIVTGTQLTSNVAIGTPPLVITSTTLVPNLYVARSVLSDTATTNANLTGDITSSGNATTYNNPLPIAIGGTGGTGGFASPTAIGGTAANTGSFTSLTSTLASATAFTVAGNQSSDTVPVATITNSNTTPKNMLSMLAANTTSGNQVYMQIGQSLTAGNSAGLVYEYHGSNNAATFMGLQFYGAGGANLKLYNSTSSATTLNTPFSATSYQSTATLGTALSSMFKAPQVVLCFAGTSGALAIPSPVPLYAKITMFGGGGGGAGCNGASSVGGSNGGNTSIQFNSNFTSVNGGTPGTSTVPGTGGTIGTTNVGYGFQYSNGGDGSYGTSTGVFFQGGRGGNSFTNPASQNGNTGLMPGVGGKGGDSANLIQSNSSGGGGGAGIIFYDTPPIGYYDYIVGSGGAGGAGGTSTGGTGAGGQIQIVYYWQ